MGDENWGSYFPLILCTVRAFLDERERGQKEGKREREYEEAVSAEERLENYETVFR